jgi:hypothetical protein
MHVSTGEAMAAQRVPPLSPLASIAFLRLGRIARSTTLVSASMRP